MKSRLEKSPAVLALERREIASPVGRVRTRCTGLSWVLARLAGSAEEAMRLDSCMYVVLM